MKDTMCIVRKAGSGNNRVFTVHFSVYCAELFYAKSVETFCCFTFFLWVRFLKKKYFEIEND